MNEEVFTYRRQALLASECWAACDVHASSSCLVFVPIEPISCTPKIVIFGQCPEPSCDITIDGKISAKLGT